MCRNAAYYVTAYRYYFGGAVTARGVLYGEFGYSRRRAAYRLACLSADERIKLLSPDKLRDTLRLNLRGIT
jgi:hypothetical protein